jgi:carbamate kinase
VRVLVALGGNALMRRGDGLDADIQRQNVLIAAHSIAAIAAGNEIVVTHGNGPQVGMLALESANDLLLHSPYPLDVLGAQTQGMIGYLLSQALGNVLPDRQVAALVTQTMVDVDDAAFGDPTKFVGPVYTRQQARRVAHERGWEVRPDGPAWRRVVASPAPQCVVESGLVRTVLASGAVTICAGGGGVPVVRDRVTGGLRGVEAVVDKDLTSGVLAEALDADVLLLLTDVDAVYRRFGTPDEEPLHRSTPAQLRSASFPAGSMGPKVAAICRFVELTGKMGAVGALEDAPRLLAGTAGTIVTPSGTYP